MLLILSVCSVLLLEEAFFYIIVMFKVIKDR